MKRALFDACDYAGRCRATCGTALRHRRGHIVIGIRIERIEVREAALA